MASGFDIITIFSAIINAYLNEGIIKRALQKGLIDVQIYNLRDFTSDKHRTVDDYPYGGGPGMVMKVEPIYNAIETIKSDGVKRKVILLSPQGKTYNQKIAERFSKETERLLFICGRYEGVDERVREFLVDEEISVGDYVLSGGELAALSIIDSVSRLIPDVVGDSSSLQEESFSWGLLDYPYYTRPALFKDMKVPEELLSGNHKSIIKWRKKHALKKTLLERPDLLKNIKFDKEDEQIIKEICSENE